MERKIYRIVVLVLFFIFISYNFSFAQTSAGQIEKAREDLDKEKILRETIEKGEKVFVKKIIVKGVTRLSETQIKEIILPFQKRWLTKGDIQGIIDSLRQYYQQHQQLTAISYEVKGHMLIINVEEQSVDSNDS